MLIIKIFISVLLLIIPLVVILWLVRSYRTYRRVLRVKPSARAMELLQAVVDFVRESYPDSLPDVIQLSTGELLSTEAYQRYANRIKLSHEAQSDPRLEAIFDEYSMDLLEDSLHSSGKIDWMLVFVRLQDN